MADPSPSRSGLDQIADEIGQLWNAIDALKAPTGTQQYNAVTTLEAAVERLQGVVEDVQEQQGQLAVLVTDLDQRITDFINQNIDGIVAAKVAEKLAGNDITIGAAGGVVRIPSIFTTDVTKTLQPRVAVWADSDGVIGHT